ncbi:hypothetical protein ZIOFF_008303 [Zingiber officinale]|uniref:DDRGK domain-containing protein 1 n=1 Tax=Zingiber officinale TaxID=94328 RepID=A0A8J5LX45_ZINOF|nr:hypothetical protein ZIOFF_008303 [Zingiber officinale]
MEGMFVGILSMLLVFVLFPLLWWRSQLNTCARLPPQDLFKVPVHAERVVRPSGARRMRRRPSAASSSVASTSEEVLVQSDEEILEADHVSKASKKKEKKKQEREAQRQAEDVGRESRQKKQDRYAEMQRRKDEEREAQERLMEEEAMARRAKEEETAVLEFEKWKGEFSVDAEGTTENVMQDDNQSLLSTFVEYIMNQKCVPLEDLAAEFKLRTQDCINRIISLENTGRLSGVMDDRGKYIYISPEEMKAVADYIKRQGRVSISHLASKSNQFIDLEPKPQLNDHVTDGISVA